MNRAPARWLLDLNLGGRRLRLTNGEPVVVDGELYVEGLDVKAVGYSTTSTRVVIFAEPEGGWAQWVARLGPLEELPAQLWWHRDGQTLDEAKLMLDGRLVDLEFDAPGEPVDGTLIRNSLGSSQLMPDPAAVVKRSDYPLAAEEAYGLAAPVVLGYPGTSQGGSNEYGCVPAPLIRDVGDGTWLIASGWISATQVDIHRVGGGDGLFQKWSNAPTQYVTTFSGQRFTIVNDASVPLGFRIQDGVYLVSHDRADPGDDHGGIGAPDGRTLRGAAEVMRWVLQRYTSIQVDDARWANAADVLDAYKLDTYIDEHVDAWEWIERGVLPFLPVKVRQGADGMFLALHRYRSTEADVFRELSTVRGDIERTSRVGRRHELRNVFSVEFCYTSRGAFRARRMLDDSGPVGSAGPGSFDELFLQRADLQRSVDRFGRREADPIRCPITWDAATAGRVLSDAADRHGWPMRAVQYVCGIEYDDLEPGMYVRVVDPEVSIDARALIEEVTLDVEEIVLDLTILDSPLDIEVPEAEAACVPPQFLLAQLDPEATNPPEVGGSIRVQTSYTGTEPTISYEWYIDGGATLLVGETTDTLDPIPEAAAGDFIRCIVTITNACGFQTAFIDTAPLPAAATSPSDLSFDHWYDATDGVSPTYVDVSGTDRLVSIQDKGTASAKATAGTTGAPKTTTTIDGASADVPGPFAVAQSHDCRATGLGRTGVSEWTSYAIVPLDDVGTNLNTYAAIRSTTIADFWFNLKNGTTNAKLQISGSAGSVEFDAPRDAAYPAGSAAIIIARRTGGRVKVEVWYDIGSGVVHPAETDVVDWYSGSYEVEDVAVGGRGTTTASWNQSHFREWGWKDAAISDADVATLAQYAADVLGWTLP